MSRGRVATYKRVTYLEPINRNKKKKNVVGLGINRAEKKLYCITELALE